MLDAGLRDAVSPASTGGQNPETRMMVNTIRFKIMAFHFSITRTRQKSAGALPHPTEHAATAEVSQRPLLALPLVPVPVQTPVPVPVVNDAPAVAPLRLPVPSCART